VVAGRTFFSVYAVLYIVYEIIYPGEVFRGVARLNVLTTLRTAMLFKITAMRRLNAFWRHEEKLDLKQHLSY